MSEYDAALEKIENLKDQVKALRDSQRNVSALLATLLAPANRGWIHPTILDLANKCVTVQQIMALDLHQEEILKENVKLFEQNNKYKEWRTKLIETAHERVLDELEICAGRNDISPHVALEIDKLIVTLKEIKCTIYA